MSCVIYVRIASVRNSYQYQIKGPGQLPCHHTRAITLSPYTGNYPVAIQGQLPKIWFWG